MSGLSRPGPVISTRHPAPPRLAVALLGAVILVLAGGAAVAAPSPFGVGLPETTMTPGGPFAGFFAWVAAQQTAFYGALTSAIKAMRADGTAGIWLMGLSFAYGVFHAAGPGHGKAVISSYIVANGETLRRGVVLSFVSAMAQALTAILLIGVAAVILRMTSIAITETTRWFELGSYLAVTLLGVALVWRKIIRPLIPERRPRALGAQVACSPLDSVFSASASAATSSPGVSSFGGSARPIGVGLRHRSIETPAVEICPDCGRSHAPMAQEITGPMSLTRAWSVILAVGLRPCTGALVVLVFAMSQGLWLAGVGATFAMALGTGLTVSLLATLAVTAKSVALRLAGDGRAMAVHRVVEGLGALLVLFLGATLLIASLGWG
ncbi:MAG: hypothetical protein CMN87_16265 [Stappia sp.]|uniref:nickel/cobalt transporter n=1 Tax=Stappia sp. TaxID=1870903 RepID=UPI000C4AF66B|nr:nickel/cobalt transporter [Stappia sp.]MAA98894.1 hypothetical protein [Stappia sp.]MBM21561.1 hypothetical protein [Stappia sp.]